MTHRGGTSRTIRGCDTELVSRALRHRDLRSIRAYDRRTADEVAYAQRRAIRVLKVERP